MSRRFAVRLFETALMLAVILLGQASPAQQQASPRSPDGIPVMTVEELSDALDKHGYQSRLIGRQITFPAVVTDVQGDHIHVKIEGIKAGFLDTASLHGHGLEETLQAGDQITVTGMLVGQDFGVWRIWVYSTDWRPLGQAPSRSPSLAPAVSIHAAIRLAEGYVRQKGIDATDKHIAVAVFDPAGKRPHWAVTWRPNQREVKGGWFRILVHEDQTIDAEFGE